LILIGDLKAGDIMPDDLSDKQQRVLEYIRSAMQENSRPPTIREIGEEFGISSTNGVRYILGVLQKKGYLSRQPLLSRGIELTPKGGGAAKPKGKSAQEVLFQVPLVGRVAAGEPLLADQNLEGMIGMDPAIVRGDGTFALRVVGDSMIDAGIFSDDIVFARPQGGYEKGEIVVAVIGDEATVKYYYPDNRKVRLEPANPHFGPIIVERSTPGFYIAGKVVGLVRKM
jgi:repressor LexA